MSESHLRTIRRRVTVLHAAERRRLPDPLADLVVLVAVATGVNLTIRALIEAARIVEARHA